MTDKRNRILAAIVSSYAYIVDHNNFGSLFQYYALQQYLKSLGVTAYWIRYVFPHLARYKSLFKKFVQALFHGYDVIFFLHYLRTQATFRSYIRTYCNVSKRKYDSIIELKRNVPVADIYITGSDQVWGGCLEPNYLTFVPRGKRKIAYAVSFGTRNITPEHAANIRNWVEDFDFVSVRESSGVEICRNLGVKARHLLDPTLLIDDNDYIAFEAKRKEKAQYAFCYFINEPNVENLCLQDIIDYCASEQFKLKVSCVGETEAVIPRQYRFQFSPESWLNHYKYAECVFTNTFHGTAFCIIFRRPFCVLLQKGKTEKQNERIYSLLDMFDLKDRILNYDNSVSSIMSREIDWDMVEDKKRALRLKVDHFWSEALNGLL